MTVTKEAADCYAVRNQHEWARIFIQGGQATDSRGEPRTWGFISVISPFGNFGHYFSHCGPGRFEDFLAGLDRSYLMGKFMGLGVTVFDEPETTKALKRLIIQKRWEKSIEANEARELFDAVVSVAAECCGRDDYMRALERDCPSRFWDWELYEVACTTVNPQARAFWDQIWTPFVAEVLRPAQAAA